MKEKGKIEEIKLIIKQERLKVLAGVLMDSGKTKKAYLPDREVSTILPRSILINRTRDVPVELLTTLEPMVRKMTCGRPIQIWAYEGEHYISFLPWRSVRFSS